MAERAFVPPVARVRGRHGDGWEITLGRDERSLIVRLMGELRALLTSDGDDGRDGLIAARLFPAVYDDAAQETEYQRLMRDDLVASRVASIDTVVDVLSLRRTPTLDEGQTMAFLQSVNAVRLVLGTMLGITDDETAEQADEVDTPEHGLYHFLGWLLEWTVRSLADDPV